jgi:hypothetical protein
MVEAMITVLPMLAAFATTLAVCIIYFQMASLQISANYVSDKMGMCWFTRQTKNINTNALSTTDPDQTEASMLFGDDINENNEELPSIFGEGMFYGISKWAGFFYGSEVNAGKWKEVRIAQRTGNYTEGDEDNPVAPDARTGTTPSFKDFYKYDVETWESNSPSIFEKLRAQYVKPLNIFGSEKIKMSLKCGKPDGVGRNHFAVTLTEKINVPFWGLVHELGIVDEPDLTLSATSTTPAFYPSFAYNTLAFVDYNTHYMEHNDKIIDFVDKMMSYAHSTKNIKPK